MSPCPICSRPAAPRAEKKSFPFCSERCKLIDLGKWLDDAYRPPDSESSEPNSEIEDKA
jgi:endogenous inhibitor of DNA gyrase (YacG/DUF329 family)